MKVCILFVVLLKQSVPGYTRDGNAKKDIEARGGNKQGNG